ncbi:MAG: hypothetical protein Tsb005_21240 [Gammaproteobacteria bacterium]
MKKAYLKIMQCIKCCSSNLDLISNQSFNDKVMEGFICCNNCKEKYPILHGIPCFLPSKMRNEEIKLFSEKLEENFS